MLVEFEELVDDGDELEDEACVIDVVGVPAVAVVIGEAAAAAKEMGEVIAVAPAGAA